MPGSRGQTRGGLGEGGHSACREKNIDYFIDRVESKIANQKKEIESQLQIGRDFANQCRLEGLPCWRTRSSLSRASKIFGRHFPVIRWRKGEALGDGGQVARADYMRGVKELTAEKEVLEKRKNDEPFIAGFWSKNEGLAQLDAGLKQLQAAGAIALPLPWISRRLEPKDR